jgi:hypothetical protein
METIFIVLLVLVGLFVAFYLIKALFIGAIFLFAWAGEQGFIGVAVYFACWIFLFPVMLGASILSGF